MAMNPRDAANAKGLIDSTKLLPHVPEMTIRFAHNLEGGKFPMRPPQINFHCLDVGEPPREALADITPANTCLSAATGFKEGAKRNVNRCPELHASHRAFARLGRVRANWRIIFNF